MKKNICLIAGLVLLIFVWTNTSFAADKIGFVNLQGGLSKLDGR